MSEIANKIYQYLQVHGKTADENCRKDLGLNIYDFNVAISELEKQGKIFVDNTYVRRILEVL